MPEDIIDPVTDGGADGGAAPDPGDAPGVVDSGDTLDAGLPDAGAGATPPWAPSPEDWQALTGTVQQLAQQLQPAPVTPQAPSYLQEDATTGESYIDPAQLSAYINYQIEQGVTSRIGQYEPIMNQVVANEGETYLQSRFTELQVPEDPLDRNVVRQLAEGYAAQIGDPGQSVMKAAELLKQYSARERAAGVEEYKKTLGAIGNAPREPGAAGAGVAGFEPRQGFDGYKDVADSWAERHGIPV